ncbi:hypothetical protein P154DRAFT_573083 [Amniculicola lignicola CBS 123094]|uniref:Uncharacterized protein n=1 Tax=Amniculicola lignicola CBS 123094 TaxID=1392246 RepID=A0A6A5WRC9_9PLEO|nr:hypothetical protein P154DRAFT_573083 [Amniculicola lignicola CBS 123094]
MHSSVLAVVFLFATQVLSMPPPPPREILDRPVEEVVDIACKVLATQEPKPQPEQSCSVNSLLHEELDCVEGPEALTVGECFQVSDGFVGPPDRIGVIYEFTATQGDDTPSEASADQKSFDSDWCREGFMEALGFAPSKKSYNTNHSGEAERNSWKLRSSRLQSKNYAPREGVTWGGLGPPPMVQVENPTYTKTIEKYDGCTGV